MPGIQAEGSTSFPYGFRVLLMGPGPSSPAGGHSRGSNDMVTQAETLGVFMNDIRSKRFARNIIHKDFTSTIPILLTVKFSPDLLAL